jgi:pimeloyl-ACP methyl ester carboxylesterase
MKSKFFKINQLKTQVHFWGDSSKPKIFFLHGWFDCGASFHFICEKLAEKYYCIAPDLRGFGKTEHTSNPLGYFFFEYLADIKDLLNLLAPDETVRLIGHSMGGNIAGLFGGVFPEQISHLVSLEGLGPAGFDHVQVLARLRKWLERKPREFRGYPNLEEVAERLRKANPILEMKKARFLAPFVSRKQKGGYAFSADYKHKWTHPFLIPLEQYQAIWMDISAKTLLIVGKNSKTGENYFQGQDFEKELKKRIDSFPKGTQFLEIPDCGHMMHHEKPDEITQILREFLEDKEK